MTAQAQTVATGHTVISGNAVVGVSSAQVFTYYVDSSGGADSNAGTIVAPWQTIAKVNGTTLTSGQSVAFKRGGLWREQLTHNVGNVTYGAYGAGVAPIITGADIFGSWTMESVTYPLGHDFTTDATGDQPTSWWMFQDASSPALDGSTNGNDIPWLSGSCSRSGSYPAGFGTAGIYSLNTPFGCYVQTLGYTSLSANFPFKAATTAATVGGWVYLVAGSNAYQTIANFGDGTTRGWRFRIGGTANQIQVLIANAAVLSANAAYTTSGWHHIAFRWNGTNRAGAGGSNEKSLWIDGVKQTNVSTSGGVVLTTSADSLTFNGTSIATTNWDEWFVAPAPYTDEEIQEIYQYGLTYPGGATGTFTDYYATAAVQPYFVVDNGTALAPASGLAPLPAGAFYYDSGTSRLHIRLAGDVAPSGHTIEASQRTRPLGNGSIANITVQDLDLRMSNGYGMIFADHLTMQRCSISYTYGLAVLVAGGFSIVNGSTISHAQAGGVQLAGGSNVVSNNTLTYTADLYPGQMLSGGYPGGIIVTWPGVYDDGTTIFGNVVHDTNGVYPYSHGMYVGQDASNVTIHDNTVYSSIAGSDISARFNGGSIYNNTLYSSTLAGIGVVQNLARPIAITIHHNLIYGNHYGIAESEDTPGAATVDLKIYNNTFYQQSLTVGGNAPLEMQLVDNLTSVEIKNNIFYALNAKNILWSVSQAAMTIDHNIYYRSDSSTGTFYYNGVEQDYSWWAANVDSSPFTDPLLTSPTADFTLQGSSPAIATGVYIAGVSTASPPNIGAK
jgi:hypothetical protein